MTNEERPDSPESQQAIIVAPKRELINVDQAVAEWDAYQELTKRLLTKDDYQRIGETQFKKKSAWRKYAKAFNISCTEISKEVVRDEDGYPLYARVVVRATEPNGRWQDADQECHVTEKCCGGARSLPCRRSHKHCMPGCDGKPHFSHPGDIPAIATTRAKNRAISDLIGAGEVSYEEAEVSTSSSRPARRPAAAKAADANGGDNGDGKARHDLKVALEAKFKDDEQAMYGFVDSEFSAGTDGNTNIVLHKIPAKECERMIALLEGEEHPGLGSDS